MNYDRFINGVASVFKKERPQKKGTVYRMEEIANSKFLDYQEKKSNVDKQDLMDYIMEIYANLLMYKHEIRYCADGKDDILCESLSTLQYVVGSFVSGSGITEFDKIIDSYKGDKNSSFLMYFHFCVGRKFKALRAEEEYGAAPKLSINGRKRMKKINALTLNLFAKKAYFCTDDELEKICGILNDAPDKMFANLNVEKIKKIIRQNSAFAIPNTINDDDDDDSVFGFFDNYSEYSEPNSLAITAEDICSTISEMKITDKNRLYFTAFIMYNFIKSEYENEPYLLKISYEAFLSLAGWITESEKEATDKIYAYIVKTVGGGAKFPKIEEVAAEVFQLNSSSQFNHSTRNIVKEIRQRLNYSRRK